jgi:hypothetical protein
LEISFYFLFPFHVSRVIFASLVLFRPSSLNLSSFSLSSTFVTIHFLLCDVVSPTPNPQPGGPGYLFLLGSSPLTCLAWEALPVAFTTASIALGIMWPYKPHHYIKLGILWVPSVNRNIFKIKSSVSEDIRYLTFTRRWRYIFSSSGLWVLEWVMGSSPFGSDIRSGLQDRVVLYVATNNLPWRWRQTLVIAFPDWTVSLRIRPEHESVRITANVLNKQPRTTDKRRSFIPEELTTPRLKHINMLLNVAPDAEFLCRCGYACNIDIKF